MMPVDVIDMMNEIELIVFVNNIIFNVKTM